MTEQIPRITLVQSTKQKRPVEIHGMRFRFVTVREEKFFSWFLAAQDATPGTSQKLRFKGGTCLRKCYFPGYRFSEDLDFTANFYITPDDLTGWSINHSGPDFLAQPYRFETVEDEYG